MNAREIQSDQDVAALAKQALRSEPGLKMAILYGSATNGKMRVDSDVDIAILLDRPLSADKKMELVARLERELQRDVDLVDLFFLNGTILRQVLIKGRVLIQKKRGALAELSKRMIYNQADIMPYVRRTLIERQQRFVHG